MCLAKEKAITFIIRRIGRPFRNFPDISLIYAPKNRFPARNAIAMRQGVANANQKENTDMRHHLKNAVKILLVAVVAGVGYYYFRLSPVPVQTVAPKVQDLMDTVFGTGTLEAKTVVSISPRSTGQLAELFADQGDNVRAGQTLCTMVAEDLKQQLKVSENELEVTKATIKRLEAVMDNTQLGSGFGIAMRDLEIRGAGNVLGKQQHGQMEKVGYEMYLKLVKEGIDEMQGKTVASEREVTLHVDGNYALDDDFISDPKSRVAFYKTVATLSSIEEGKAYFRHLKECYGKPPENTEGILKIAIMKNLAQRAGVKEVRIGERTCEVRFYDNSCMTSEKLFEAMEKYKTRAILNPSSPPSITFSCKQLTLPQKINLILLFLSLM